MFVTTGNVEVKNHYKVILKDFPGLTIHPLFHWSDHIITSTKNVCFWEH